MMKNKVILVLAAVFATVAMQAQTVNCRIVNDNYHDLQLVLTTGEVQLQKVALDGRTFTALTVDGYMPSAAEGCPNLPVFSQLIEVPLCEGFEVVVSGALYDTLQVSGQVMPVQPSRSKSDRGPYPLSFNEKVYSTNAFYGTIGAEVEAVGIARDRRLARLQFNPMSYNPVSGQLVVCRQATVTVRYVKSDEAATRSLFERYHSPAFASGAMSLNSLYPKTVANAAPLRYLIVAHSMFRGQLDTFVQWKRRKGFITDIVYTDDPGVGTTTTAIQSYITSQYTNATATNPAPTYLLIVGDHEQIPAFTGTTSSAHITDLYYISWTAGDNIPDCYCGRFSAQSVSDLTPQVQKTLMYEQYTFADPSFLDRAVMVAGVDGGSSGDYGYTHADPAMDYAIINYINGSRGFSQVMYFKNNTSIVPAGSNVTVGTNASSNSATVRSYYNQGAGLINYSAHGSATSWGTPNFTTDHAAAMTNTQKFGLMIGNCCLTNKFQTTTCLGEAVLRKGNYCGAVGYIGGSNSTYWNEDFYWAVGLRSSISATMSMAYNAANLGVYDRVCHTHGEAYQQWVLTQGDLMFQGNMAVESSTTSRKLYYWEIYHLMGDPSVMPYLTQASVMPLTAPQAIVAGTNTLQVTAVPHAYVALTAGTNHTVVAAAYADASGSALLLLPASLAVGTYELTASAQHYRTAFQNVTVIMPNGPHVAVTNIVPATSLIAGATVPVTLTVTNMGTDMAHNVVLRFSTSSPVLEYTIDSLTIDSLMAGATVTLTNAFSARVAFDANDGETVMTYAVSRWQGGSDSVRSVLTHTVLAPRLQVSYSLNPLCMQPGTSATLGVTLTNSGHAALPAGYLTLASPFLLLEVTADNSTFSLPVGGSVTRNFTLDANSQLPTGIELPLVLAFHSTENLPLDTVNLYLGNSYVETFEGTQFTLSGWSQGTYPWVIIDTFAYAGTHSARSTSALTHSQTAELTLTRTLTVADSISFYYKVSSEANYDKFHFLIDGTDKLTLSGEIDWTRAAFPVSAGTHTFKFTYAKDVSVNKFSDCVWIDNVVLPHEVHAVAYSWDTVMACDSYTLGDSIHTSSFTYGEVQGYTLLTRTVIINPSYSDTVEMTVQGDSYSWNDSVYSESGLYSQEFQTMYGCDSIVTLQLTLVPDTIGDTTLVIAGLETLSLTAYPNPTRGMLHFGQTVDEVTVYDMQGRRVAIRNKVQSVDLRQLPAGTYLLKVKVSGHTATCRVVRR